ncbi:MAG TPA: VacB/RNase II family 3'-5' exoribonuclease [Baekduia sp.]|nr:VacB/RNase II family 3'-5' exoribonuclease [Baekduia sp.]
MSDDRAAPAVMLLQSRGKFLTGEPFFGRGPRETIERSKNAVPGRLAFVLPAARGRAKIVRMLGHPHVAKDVVEALMLERGLARKFPPGVEKAAQKAIEAAADATDARRDLRDLPTFTIDPATARDFDDAISAETIGDAAWRLWVHIADVSAYVKPGSAVDREAFQRSTSTYVPGLVEPMLPEVLSNGVCSLVPGEDRLAVTVEFELHGSEVRKPVFYRALIRSDRRYTYEQVDELFAENAKLEPGLTAARAAAAALQKARERQGALEVDSAEPEFEFERGHVVSMRPSVQTESHVLIEHLMIAANEQVAKLLAERKLPALFRIHERPDGDRVERLLTQLASLDVPTPPAPEYITSQQAAEIVAEASRKVAEYARRTGRGRIGLTSLVLRSLQQAKYSPVNKGHAGLGLQHYCHFTSPIRRYPDLICHRALLAAIGGGEDAPRASAMEAAADWTSTRERDAMVIERDADGVARSFYLESQLMKLGWQTEFDGEVTGVINAGVFVAFADGHEGMVPVRNMRDDWWELNEPGTILIGTREGGAIRIGDAVRVKVVRVDTAKGRTDLEFVDPAGDGELT